VILGLGGTLGHAQPTVRGRLRDWCLEKGRCSLASERVAIAVRPWSQEDGETGGGLATDPQTGSWLAVSGRPIDDEALDQEPRPIAHVLLERLTTRGLDALAQFDGAFAIAWFDARQRRLHLIRDRFGIEPLFYAEAGAAVVFGSRLRDLRMLGILPGALDGQGLAEFLLYGYVPGEATLDRGARRMPPGSR
jgi:asparagine synthase (glutamine-hydrolysing)